MTKSRGLINRSTQATRDAITKEILEQKYNVELKTQYTIANECGVSRQTIGKLLRQFDIPLKPNMVCENITGKTFGEMYVVCHVLESPKGKFFHWKCTCSKNHVNYLKTHYVTSGKARCESCYNKMWFNNSNWKGCGNIPGLKLKQIKIDANKRNLQYKLTGEYLNELFIKQQGKCIFTGRKLIFKDAINCKKEDWNASLDRIDSDKDYEEGNVQWVDKDVNFIKGKMSDEKFIAICKEVANHVK